MFKTSEELRAKIAEYKAELDEKFSGADGKTYLMLCGGTGCMAGGTMNIKERFEEAIAKVPALMECYFKLGMEKCMERYNGK